MTVNKIRRNGSYAPLSAHYYKDDAIDEAGESAELLYVRGLAFCADVLSDGFISDRQLTRFVGVGMFDAKERAETLVKVGLWERSDGGYQVRSWLDWNRSRSEITDAQAKDRDRKARSGSSDRPDPEPPNGGGNRSERNPNGIQSESVDRSERSPDGIQPRAGVRARTPLHSTPLQEELLATAPAVPDRFDEFWSLYPRRVKKQDAVKAWKQVTRRVSADQVLGALRAQVQRWRAEGKETQYIPHPPSWLRGARWDDEPEQGRLSLVPDQALVTFETLRERAAAREASRLLGIAFIPAPQPPSDPTPPQQWAHDRAVDWINAHEAGIRSALASREAG